MDSESDSPYAPGQPEEEAAKRNRAITSIKERYLNQAKSDEDFSAAVPEPYPGARSQTRIRANATRRLAENAEEIYNFEESLSEKSTEEVRAEIADLESKIEQLGKQQLEIRAKARKYQILHEDSGRVPDRAVLHAFDQEELDNIQQSNVFSELKRIANDRLKG